MSKENYEDLFHQVCVYLNDGWKIHELKDTYIKLTSNNYENYLITIKVVKDRFKIFGFVDYYKCEGYFYCSVSRNTDARGIANNIVRKILSQATQHINIVNLMLKIEKEKQKETERLKETLSNIVSIDNSYDDEYYFTYGEDKKNQGCITQNYHGSFEINLNSMNKKTLIKILEILSSL